MGWETRISQVSTKTWIVVTVNVAFGLTYAGYYPLRFHDRSNTNSVYLSYLPERG
jgi:hypothetical protein